ncbi:MAG: nitrilase [Desulfobacterales bacterium]|nr:MAG: nitrilase [Desulfobacterales bacterium]
MKDIRISAVICNSPINNTRNNLEDMTRWVKASKKEDAAIICFPEMNITGYSSRIDIKSVAEPIPGSSTQYIRRLAASEKMVILAGIVEKDKKGRIFASHLVVKPNGFVGVYRKVHIAPPERNILTPGNSIPLFETHDIKFGIQLCYDAHFPELTTYMANQGADLIFIPHASPRGTPEEKYQSWMRHLPARAYDNGLFIVACNQIGKNNKGLNFPGLALLINPSGEVIQKKLSRNEGMMVADLKAKDLDWVRNHKMRYFLPNRRPELYP